MEEEMTLPPELQSRLKELGQLGADPSVTAQPQQPKFPVGGKLSINGSTVTEPSEAPVVQPSQMSEIIGTPDDDDNLEGTDGPDKIFGLEGVDQIAAFLSADYIDAGPGDDNVVAGGGNDTVDGGLGEDLIFGDFNPGADPNSSAMGDDILNGGFEKDYLFGQNGNDTLNGDDGPDYLYGANGYDILNGGPGNDTAEGGTGNDQINGNSGDDRLRGDDGNDFIDGGSEKDFIRGGRGNDTLIGGSEDDELKGELGNDRLEGGTGNDKLIGVDDTTVLSVPELGFGRGEQDTLIGGAGNDTFVLGTRLADGRDFRFYNDANPGNAGTQDYALITDFELFKPPASSFDKVQLAGLRSNYSLGASPISSISGTGLFYTDSPGAVSELIGIVQNVALSQLNLANTSQFTFV